MDALPENDQPESVIQEHTGAPRWVIVLMSLTMLAVCFSLWNQGHIDDRQDEKIETAVERNTFLTNCTKAWAKSQGDSAEVVRAATVARERQDQKVKDTAVAYGVGSTEFNVQNEKLRSISAALEEARRLNPPPKWEDFCEKKGK